jgi:hypothetical protein
MEVARRARAISDHPEGHDIDMTRRFAAVLLALVVGLIACGDDHRTALHCEDEPTPPSGTITASGQLVTVEQTELRESPGGEVLFEIAADQPLLDLANERDGQVEVACMFGVDAATNGETGFVDKDDVERKPSAEAG